ncbi:MAG TPA: hypothetical protein VGB24_02490 [Longimicrobium sp.]|jgi:hypothetical protein|uniref:hypothetical protein n=1 Tax=Longimicrobium sp. TaxID=2029185 RepID=UPI002ED9A0AC
MSARSVKAIFVNTTNLVLTLKATELVHGEWATQPPGTIGPNSQGEWEAHSHGTLTGVEGTVAYNIGQGQGQSVSTYFDNPYIGSNVFTATVTPNTAFSCAATSDGGNDAKVTYTLAAT